MKPSNTDSPVSVLSVRLPLFCSVMVVSITLSAGVRGVTLINESFDTDPNLFFQNNGVFNLSAPGAGQWAAGQLDSTIFSDIDGEVVGDIDNGLIYNDERTRSFLYYLDLGAAQTTYAIGDDFNLSVNLGGNPGASFDNMTANIGIFTTNNLSLRVDTVHPSTNAADMATLFTNEGTIAGSDFEFYEAGVTTLTTAGATASGLAFSSGEGQSVGSDTDLVVVDGMLNLNGTFTESHRYLGIALLSNVGTNSDNTRWMAFDNATLEITAVPEPAFPLMTGVGMVVLFGRRQRRVGFEGKPSQG